MRHGPCHAHVHHGGHGTGRAAWRADQERRCPGAGRAYQRAGRGQNRHPHHGQTRADWRDTAGCSGGHGRKYVAGHGSLAGGALRASAGTGHCGRSKGAQSGIPPGG